MKPTHDLLSAASASLAGGVAAVLVAGSVYAMAAETTQTESPRPQQPEPGEGVLCAFGIYTAVAEVAKVCFPGEDAPLRDTLSAFAARLEAYVVANSGEDAEAIARFKREQGLVGAPKEQLCSSSAVMLYRSMQRAGAEKIRQSMEETNLKPGKPTWGTCF